jgi:hypothetical protein
MSKMIVASQDSFFSAYSEHSLSSLPDSAGFDLLDEFYSVEEAEGAAPDDFQDDVIQLSTEEARLADMLISGLQKGGMSAQGAALLVALYACSVESRAISQEVSSYVC